MSNKVPAFLPRNEFVLIKEITENKSKGGIVLPENTRRQDEITTGTVQAVGLDVKLGDTLVDKNVLFNRFTGHKINGSDGLFLVDQKDVIAVVL